MTEPPGPDEPGFNFDDWFGFALNVGLKLASQVGLGLRLFNALRERFEGVDYSILGELAGTIGQAIRAATGLSGPALNQALVLDELPVVPVTWNQGEPGDRILAGFDITWDSTIDGRTNTRQQWVNGLEFLTPADLEAEALALFNETMKSDTPRYAKELREAIAYMFFLAKRF